MTIAILSRLAWLRPRFDCLASCFVAGFCRETVRHFSGTCLAAPRHGVDAHLFRQAMQALARAVHVAVEPILAGGADAVSLDPVEGRPSLCAGGRFAKVVYL